MKLGLSDPPHPLFPSDLWSRSATVMMLQPKLEDQGMHEVLHQNGAVPSTSDHHSCNAVRGDKKFQNRVYYFSYLFGERNVSTLL